MRVVSDTSPISNLAIIGRLDLLRRFHGIVLIAPAVERELSRLRHPEGRAAVEAALAGGWLKIEPLPSAPPPIPGLDEGETESIALALTVAGTELLMDEAEGRKAARLRGLPLSGVIWGAPRGAEEGVDSRTEAGIAGPALSGAVFPVAEILCRRLGCRRGDGLNAAGRRGSR